MNMRKTWNSLIINMSLPIDFTIVLCWIILYITYIISGMEAYFVKIINEKAEEIVLPDYKFVNSTGLANSSLGDNYPEGTEPDDNNLMSSRSSALLAYHLINDYPEALDI